MSEPLWTLGALTAAVNGALHGAAPDTPVSGISIDTRTLQPGDAFFAIEGVRTDGHEFVAGALDKGASAAIVNRGAAQPRIEVPDVLAALEALGRAARLRLAPSVPVVAVTGSVGKTGTKELLRLAFGAQGTAHASAASYNNHWGVPLSLARTPSGVSSAIFEIGMNHTGEIRPLTAMTQPTIAIVTWVAAVHLEFFDSVASIADAKAEIFEGLSGDKIAVIPADNEYAGRLAAAARRQGATIVTFGTDSLADVGLLGFDDESRWVRARVFGEEVQYGVGEGGRHIAQNSLAVLAALSAAGRSVREGAAAMEAWTAPRGRGREVALITEGGPAVLLDDAYNANPSSMTAAIGGLGRRRARRRVAILGDMRELGPTAPDLHRGLAETLLEADVRIVHTVGPMSEHLRDALPHDRRGEHAATAAALSANLPPVEPGDAVLVKGSLGTGLGAVVDALEEAYGKDRRNA